MWLHYPILRIGWKTWSWIRMELPPKSTAEQIIFFWAQSPRHWTSPSTFLKQALGTRYVRACVYVFICVYACVCLCVFICVCVSRCVYLCLWMYIDIFLSSYVYLYLHICVNVILHLHAYFCIVSAYMYLRFCACIFVSVCTYLCAFMLMCVRVQQRLVPCIDLAHKLSYVTNPFPEPKSPKWEMLFKWVIEQAAPYESLKTSKSN